MQGKGRHRIILPILLLLGLALSLIAPYFPGQIEALYAGKLYYWTIRPYSLYTGLFPFSLAEFTLISLGIFAVYQVAIMFISISRGEGLSLSKLPGKLTRLAFALALLYLSFNLMWGLNHNRLTFAEIMELELEPSTVEELAELARHLVAWANELREQVVEDERGVMTLPRGIPDMFNRAQLGFEEAAKIYPQLGGRYGSPKGVLLSRYWSYTGISGTYFPFTAEANVNIHMPHLLLPATTAHEMAHQRGFAREDEANYIAYLACTQHPDPDFQYSGVMLALIHTMGSLAKHHRESWQEIRAQYSPGVSRDLLDYSQYWKGYEGPINETTTRVNDTYLMANGQKDGIESYGRMVDLLLAEFRRQQ
ncbi:MAG: DUF3810 domain-containing protein [bacterium]|nr:DUF3810 domain-containing protein [Bacillota bacterium]HHW55800.1 DUF3810 domain-containing protein [Bacillota bacterium]